LNDYGHNLVVPRHGFDRALEAVPILAALEFIDDLDRYAYLRAYKGFEQWFDRPHIDFDTAIDLDIDLKRAGLQIMKRDFTKDLNVFRTALEALIWPSDKLSSFNGLPLEFQLPILTPDAPSIHTDNVARELHALIHSVFGGDSHYTEIMILAECRAYMKRFERNRWQVQTEDIISMWQTCMRYIEWQYQMHPEVRKLYTKMLLTNNANKGYSQWDAIKAGVNRKYVAQELRKDTGRGVVGGICERREGPRGYWLTERGRRLILNEFALEVDGEIIKAVEGFKE